MPPETIEQYKIIRKLGDGGMGQVYLAQDTKFRTQRLVAIKFLLQGLNENPDARLRFEREAELIASLEHAAIVPVYDYGELDGKSYLVMRYMPGGSLRDRIVENGPMSLIEASEILARIAPAIDKANQRGVVHRDIKPANILFDGDGSPYISDFGIAKITADPRTLNTSILEMPRSSGGFVGTVPYMSPEQVLAKEDLDGRSDQYALGVTLFEMLTGRTVFEATSLMGVAMAHLKEKPPSILKIRRELPKALGKVMEKVLAKEPAQRFKDSTEFATQIETLARGTSKTRQQKQPTKKDNPYRLVENLPWGGHSSLDIAEDTRDGRRVLLRRFTEFLSPLRTAEDQFNKLAKPLLALHHPAILPVYDYGVEDHRPYIVSQYHPARTLRSWQANRMQASNREVIQVLSQLAPALDKAHRAKLMHGFISPETILLDVDEQVYLSDFGTGLEYTLEPLLNIDTLTLDQYFVFAFYSAPECFSVESFRPSPRSDQYSLAVVLWEMLTGLPLFAGNSNSAFEVSRAHREQPIPSLAIARPDLPAALDQVLRKALAKEPAERYSSVGAFAKAFQTALAASKTEKLNKSELQAMEPTRQHRFASIKTGLQRLAQLPNKLHLGILPAALLLGLLVPSRLTLPERFNDWRGHQMALVPAGEFVMGSDFGSDERPRHNVFLSHYYIDIFEVTNAQYAAFLNSTHDSYTGTVLFQEADVWVIDPAHAHLPVVEVDWFEANAFCRWRGAKLPTEAQWEKAARGTDGRLFPWGNSSYISPTRANFANSNSGLVRVGSFTDGTSPFGAMDMAGNVWEWVADWYQEDYYSQSPNRDPSGPSEGVLKVRRGGSVGDNSALIRTTSRNAISPHYSDSVIGFRCARPANFIPVGFWVGSLFTPAFPGGLLRISLLVAGAGLVIHRWRLARRAAN